MKFKPYIIGIIIALLLEVTVFNFSSLSPLTLVTGSLDTVFAIFYLLNYLTRIPSSYNICRYILSYYTIHSDNCVCSDMNPFHYNNISTKPHIIINLNRLRS